jgi:hypothetical protein
MVTPKTDIVQSVGRILRVKHNNPIIVDIVDTHSIFQNQWTQRMQYYKKCNYSIRQISSSQYQGMSINWEKDTTWKRLFQPKKPYEEMISKKTTNEFFGSPTIPIEDSNSSTKTIEDKNDLAKPSGNTIFTKCMVDMNLFS